MRIWITLLLTFISTEVFADNIAVITKALGEVLLSKVASPNVDQAVTKGTFLEMYDQVKVNDGFAVLLLFDSQSQFKLRENTETSLTWVQERSGSAFRIRLDYGQALADFKTGDDTGFYIHTPTSVISVKGTSFWTISDPEEGDNVIVLDGVVDLENNMSGETSTARAGQSIRSTPAGIVEVAPTLEGSIPTDPESGSEISAPKEDMPLDSAKVVEEKHTTRDIGIILGVVMVILFALAL